VGAGEGPCAVLMIGSRREDAIHYTVNETAARFGAAVSRETDAHWRPTPTGARKVRTPRSRTLGRWDNSRPTAVTARGSSPTVGSNAATTPILKLRPNLAEIARSRALRDAGPAECGLSE
jgi:hypothetical protein